jgi:hypothetical protein
MTSLVTIYQTAVVTVDIDADAIHHSIKKDVKAHADSDGVNRWQEDNRYIESWNISGTVTLAAKEILTATAKIVTGATYPKLRVYDASAGPNYTDYSPVRLLSVEDARVNDDEYRVTVTASR